MSVNTLDPENGMSGPWILACDYCNWTTLDIGIQFDRPNNIHSQLAKVIRNPLKPSSNSPTEPDPPSLTLQPLSPEQRFSSLRTFYTNQLSQSSASANPLLTPLGDFNYSSPSSLARIMSLYTGLGSYGKKASKPTTMREALSPSEGLLPHNPAHDAAIINRLRTEGWSSTTSPTQQSEQPHSPLSPPRFTSDLLPVPALLRTKRSKRCRTCRHILVKPEPKVQSTRYRIKLLAIHNVPSISLKPLHPSSSSSSSSHLSSSSSTSPPQQQQQQQQQQLDLTALPPTRPLQFLLTLKNPMFDPVKISLATPRLTPGRFPSRVTILCPQFEIGPNTDVWDEALATSAAAGGVTGGVAEAGKVWDRGRNWTSVVLEVVPALIEEGGGDAAGLEEDEDEDVLEIPVFVRVEYESEAQGEEGGDGGGKERREKRELAFWCVLGVGRIARVGVRGGDAGA
ncbi:hypothetical protein MMC20_003786 [Loxospora ochrophaea]|nr:hypothetical protein [Loxospora ochrophaea]